MITKDQLQFGDILATHGKSMLARSIRFFMKLYMKSLGRNPKMLFNHNAVVINVYGEKWIAEALGWGPRIYPVEKSGYLTNKMFIVLRDKRGFTPEQIETMSKKMLSMGGVRYQYEAFFQWVGKIIFKKKTFHANGETEVNCSELAAIAINAVHPNTFTRPNEMSPMDHVFSSTYNIVDINNIYLTNEKNN